MVKPSFILFLFLAESSHFLPTVQYSLGRFFHTTKLTMKPNSTSTSLTSFSTSFVFSILPQIATSPGFGLAFFISNSTSPPNAIASQYSPSSRRYSPSYSSSRRYSPSYSTPAETPSSTTPTITTSESTSTTSNTPTPQQPGTSTPPAASFRFRCRAARTSGLGSNSVLASRGYLYWRKKKLEDEEDDDEIEDWEMEYWPHRFSNEELSVATGGFSNDQLLGSGGFGANARVV